MKELFSKYQSKIKSIDDNMNVISDLTLQLDNELTGTIIDLLSAIDNRFVDININFPFLENNVQKIITSKRIFLDIEGNNGPLIVTENYKEPIFWNDLNLYAKDLFVNHVYINVKTTDIKNFLV